MLKALFLDMDDTLCDTQRANRLAEAAMAEQIRRVFGLANKAAELARAYVEGIYRRWTPAQQARYLPIITAHSEGTFRLQLIRDLLTAAGISSISDDDAEALRTGFDQSRLSHFDFYAGIPEFLDQARQQYTLVVITNGPEYSQLPKLHQVNLFDRVDHVIVGGQEPEEKPAASIFNKALALCSCQPQDVLHVGDSLKADIQGAHNSGITSVWVQHQQTLDPAIGITPTYTISHPQELPAMVRSIAQSAIAGSER